MFPSRLRLIEDPPGIFHVAADDGTQPQSARFRVQSIDSESIVEDLTQLVNPEARLVVNEEQNLVIAVTTLKDVVPLIADQLVILAIAVEPIVTFIPIEAAVCESRTRASSPPRIGST